MILSFRRRGLKRFYERGDRSLIRHDLHDWVEVMLAQLDVAGSPEAMRLPQYRLHSLKGNLEGYGSVSVRANWRIIFRFENEDVQTRGNISTVSHSSTSSSPRSSFTRP